MVAAHAKCSRYKSLQLANLNVDDSRHSPSSAYFLSLVRNSGDLGIVASPLLSENQSKFHPQMPPYALL